MPEVPAEVLQDMAAYVEKTDAILEKAASIDTEVANRAPAVVDALIKAGMLEEAKRQIAIDNIRDPLKTLESLRKSAEFVRTKAAAAPEKPVTMGSGANDMNKSAGSSEAGRGAMKESDQVFMRGFGFTA